MVLLMLLVLRRGKVRITLIVGTAAVVRVLVKGKQQAVEG